MRWKRYWREGVAGLCCALMFGWQLGALPLATPNEGLYALAAREMLERHDWVVPHINGVVYFEKPPLLYWLMALALHLGGITAGAARAPSALAGFLTAAGVFWLGRRLFDKEAGTFAAVVVATSIGFVIMARQVMFDALLTACMTLALAAWWLAASRSSAQSSCRSRLMLLAYFALALAVLTKGFLGLLLPFLVVAAYGAATRDGARLRVWRHAGGALLFLAVTVPWHVAAAQRQPEFTWFYFVNEHLLRFLGRRQPADFHCDPIFTPWVAVALLLLPWSALLPAALVEAIVALREEQGQRRADMVFLFCWILAPLFFFTLSRTRVYYYQLPIVPPLALLLGHLWTRAAAMRERRRWLLVPLLIFFGIGIAVCFYCGVRAEPATVGGRRALIAFIGSALISVGLAGTLALLLKRDSLRAALCCLALGTAAAWLATLRAAQSWPPLASEASLATTIEALPSPARSVVAVEGRLESHSSFAFYLPRALRPVYVVNGRLGGDLEFGSRFPDARDLFIANSELNRLAAERPLFYLSENPPRTPPPPTLRLLRRDERALLWGPPAPQSAALETKRRPGMAGAARQW